MLCGSAQADQNFAPTCGNSGSDKFAQIGADGLTYQGDGRFHIEWLQVCGSSVQSVEVEVQRSTDGGNHWHDVTSGAFALDDIIGTSGSQAGQALDRFHQFYPSACGSGMYRGKVYDANHSTTSLLNTFGYC